MKTAVIVPCRQQDMDSRPESEQKWCLYTRDESKLLGRHPSKEKALKQEQAIQIQKVLKQEQEKRALSTNLRAIADALISKSS